MFSPFVPPLEIGDEGVLFHGTSRREFLTSVGAIAALGAVQRGNREAFSRFTGALRGQTSLPAKKDFVIPDGVTYINCAYIHPLPIAAADAARRYWSAARGPKPRRVSSGTPISRRNSPH